MNSTSAAEYLNTLITFRDITAISKMNATALIDDQYGFQVIGMYFFPNYIIRVDLFIYSVTFYFVVNIWEEFKFILIGAAVGSCIRQCLSGLHIAKTLMYVKCLVSLI